MLIKVLICIKMFKLQKIYTLQRYILNWTVCKYTYTDIDESSNDL